MKNQEIIIAICAMMLVYACDQSSRVVKNGMDLGAEQHNPATPGGTGHYYALSINTLTQKADFIGQIRVIDIVSKYTVPLNKMYEQTKEGELVIYSFVKSGVVDGYFNADNNADITIAVYGGEVGGNKMIGGGVKMEVGKEYIVFASKIDNWPNVMNHKQFYSDFSYSYSVLSGIYGLLEIGADKKVIYYNGKQDGVDPSVDEMKSVTVEELKEIIQNIITSTSK